MICTVGQKPALHTLLSLYASVSDFLRPFRVEKLLALFYIDNNANGRKECYGTDFCVRARHERPRNLSENTISVNHNLIYRVIDGKAGFHITTPKTESGTRIIPILYPEVAEQLRLQIETIDALYPDDQLVLGGVHGFVFRNRTGSFMSAHNINRAIERISVTYNMEEMDQAELEDREPDLLPHFSVHNLRHTFCTRLCESTNDVKFIQQVMGHADFSTTMDIYTHITQENMQEKAKNISVNMKLM